MCFEKTQESEAIFLPLSNTIVVNFSNVGVLAIIAIIIMIAIIVIVIFRIAPIATKILI